MRPASDPRLEDRRRPGGADEPHPFRDAEAWLAARGVPRQPVTVSPQETAEVTDGPTPVDAARISDGRSDSPRTVADASPTEDVDEDVAEALAFIRRSTGAVPQSEGRIRAKLTERGWQAGVIDEALARARAERLVDDLAMAAALVEERRAKGHAAPRIRRDLRERGFDPDTLDTVLADAQREDPEAAAFDLAVRRAAGLTAIPAEKAFTRIVGYLARRGYADGLARKVARAAVFNARDPERVSGH